MANRRRGRSGTRSKRISDHGPRPKVMDVKEQPATTATEAVAAPEDSPTTAG
ncbi:hypothetical protein [Actinacidiphila guanduensis]|uniref:Uncharacterized protein n=1 Tax=Actinacidiphila guanduensis TaxID=310781 RepID=A0A1H0DEA2_9ACTN|nr:hypothetical protein [Actinacidiphila guanduensis]SDN68597.1 hypothetical protein SAMN05216259_105190 [Actinacidiphila guanduensis]